MWKMIMRYLQVLVLLCWITASVGSVASDKAKLNKCHPSYFECTNSICIKGDKRCNHVDDCGDNSDEINCDVKSAPTSCPSDSYMCTNPPMCISLDDLCSDFNQCTDYDAIDSLCPVTCQPHKMKCLSVSQCVPKKYICDGNKDCMDGSDELRCDDEKYKCQEEADSFLCDDRSHCIFAVDVCDGHAMCDDGSDEKNDCQKLCKAKNCGPNQLCLPEGRGVKCICKDGYKFDEKKNCVEINYCNTSDIDRPCSQTCLEGHFGRGPQCRCITGYTLDRDGSSCNAIGPEAILYVATDREIHRWSVKSRQHSTLIDGLKGVRGLAVDSFGGRIFWSEMGSYGGQPEVYTMNIEGRQKTKTVIASFGLQKPEGLAYDFITKSLYIVDSGVPAILACELGQKHCATVFNNTVVNFPKDIVVNPAEGVLYYTETGSEPAIMRGSMDGKSVDALVSINIHRPTSLHLDLTTNRLYWIDSIYSSGQIFKVDLDGSNKKPVMSHKISSPNALSIFEDSIYWVNSQTKGIMTANKFTADRAKTLFQTTNQPSTMAIEHNSLQNDHVINRCHSNRCHLCLLNDQGSGSCFCSQGYRVAFTDRYCEKIESPSFLLASDKTQILRIPLHMKGRPTPTYVKTPNMRDVNSLAYLPKSHSILYSNMDVYEDGISGASIGLMRGFDGGTALSSRVVSGVSSVISIAADEASSLVFWTDHKRRSIRVASLDGAYNASLPINTTLPIALYVDAAQGVLYFSEIDTSSSRAIIKLCRLDGQWCSTLVSDRIQFPNHLLSDGQQLYWSDYSLGEISTIDRWGHDRATIVLTDGSPLSFALDSGILYWIEDGRSSIFYKHVHKDGGYEGRIETEATSLEDLIAVVPYTLPQSACSYLNGGCEQICISIHRSAEVSCMCSEGFRLHEDKRQCIKDNPNCRSHLCPGENRCLDQSQICDGRFDCQDWSDENGCLRMESCSQDEFQCDNGKCIAKVFVCDRDDDCKDGSDEIPESCSDKCNPDDHICDGGSKCVPNIFVCDEEPDCNDKSDEANCPYQDCDEDEFLCRSKECISRDWVCDGDKDCDDGSDELLDCETETCFDEEFTCNDGVCLDQLEVCDQFEHCNGGEDEKGCPPVEMCSENEYKCSNGDCIQRSAKCDGFNDCTSHEDEEGCDDLCGEHEFQCENKKCISFDLFCDQKKDCPDGSDENSSCIPPPPPSVTESSRPSETGCQGFTCGNGRCIDAGKRCDGTTDCVDNADEVNCESTCRNFNRCGQICKDTPSGLRCACEPGYQIKSDGLACEDIDECKIQNGGCSHRCINVKGLSSNKGLGFKCQCFYGFERGLDYYSCKARGKRADLYIGTASGMRVVSSEGHHVHESLIKASRDHAVWKVQVDVQRKSIFWAAIDRLGVYSIHKMELGQDQPQDIFSSFIIEFALDWITDNLYVIHETDLRQMSVLKVLDSSNQNGTSLLKHDLYTPDRWSRGLALHPKKGYMFYTTGEFSLQLITKATMDGKEFIAMPQASRHADRVLVLSVDINSDRLYWINSVFGQLKSVTIDDKDLFTYDLHTNLHRSSTLDIFEGVAYFKRKNSVLSYALHKGGNQGIKTVARLNMPLSIQVYHPLQQPSSPNPCKKKDCMYMCLLSDNGGASCICPQGYRNAKNPNCQGSKVPLDAIIKQQSSPKNVGRTTTPSDNVHKAKEEKTMKKTAEQQPQQQTSKTSLVFTSKCTLWCLNGGSCVMDGIYQSCGCLDEFDGPRCERKKEQEKKEEHKEEESSAWVAGVVVGLVLIVFLVVFSLWYFKFRRHNRRQSSIRFKKQNKFVICNQRDKDGLVPEISFGNPGFQEEIDEEAHMDEDQDWWKKLLSRSRRSVDSAFHSKTSVVADDALDDRCLRGDPQDPVMSDKARLLK